MAAIRSPHRLGMLLPLLAACGAPPAPRATKPPSPYAACAEEIRLREAGHFADADQELIPIEARELGRRRIAVELADVVVVGPLDEFVPMVRRDFPKAGVDTQKVLERVESLAASADEVDVAKVASELDAKVNLPWMAVEILDAKAFEVIEKPSNRRHRLVLRRDVGPSYDYYLTTCAWITGMKIVTRH